MVTLLTALAMFAAVQTDNVRDEDDLIYHWSAIFQQFDDALSGQDSEVLAIQFVAETRQWRDEVVRWNEDRIKELAEESRRARDSNRRRQLRNEIRRLGTENRALKRAKPGDWPTAKIRRIEPGKMGVLDLACEIVQVVDDRNVLVSYNRGSDLLWITNVDTNGMVDDEKYQFDYIFRILEEPKTFRTVLGSSRTVRVARAVAEFRNPSE